VSPSITLNTPRSREIQLWWPLPLAILVWLLMIWAFGYYLSTSESEEEIGVSIPDAIEAQFIELPELAQPQESPPPPQKGIDQPPDTEIQQAKIEPAPSLPPPPRTRPQEKPVPPPVRQSSPETVKTQPPREKIATEKQPQMDDSPPPADLSEYINQRRVQQNRPAGIFDGIEHSNNKNAEPQPSADEIRLAKVKRNLQTPGTSGIFQIRQISPRYAQFSFRAWTTNISNPRVELIEVKAGPGEDIERVIIRRMIQLIREYHQEDFNWESYRLNRVISLSARPRDQEGLEDFLMREFFDEPLPAYLR